MAIRVLAQRNQQSIVPIRFCRVVTGDPVRDAPDVDDRGFAMGNRPATWGRTNARGAMVGIREGDTIRIKVLHEDIENAADLYVTSSNTNVVRVVSPADGGPLLNNGIFQILGVADRKNSPVKVQVRYGAADGPVIGELEPHIFQEISVRVCFHLVTIYGTATGRNEANVRDLLDQVNDIWRPCGIQFTTHSVVQEQIRRQPTPPNRSQYLHRATGTWRSLPAPLGVANHFTHAGTITSDNRWGAGNLWREFDTLISVNFVNNTVNVYCVAESKEWNAAANGGAGAYEDDWVGLSNVGPGNGNALAITDDADNYDLAHELGHYLGNNHADQNSANNDTHDQNIWLVRRLMYSLHPADNPDYRNDIGYGADQYGALISVKKLRGTYQNADGELAPSRRNARNPY